MRTADFDFHLPEDCIALEPARPRDAARLLHVGERSAGFGDLVVRDLPSLLRAGDILVVNDTKVIPAQLKGVRPTRVEGGSSAPVSIDATLIRRHGPEPADGAAWDAFVRPAKRLRAGDVIDFAAGFFARVEVRDDAQAILKFNVAGAAFDAALARAGAPPLPPYIARKRALKATDADDYQTVYAEEAGSVAAPTAGLHFTDALIEAIRAKGVAFETITLHVGAGTFLPVAVEDVAAHKMHAEWGEITEEQAARINAVRAAGGRIVAVGTTALRLLESAATESGEIRPFREETSIFITPGYTFRAVDALMTNFHLPRSTLFMLVCAFAGTEKMKAAYAHAVESGYRFYSYGDSSFLERAQ